MIAIMVEAKYRIGWRAFEALLAGRFTSFAPYVHQWSDPAVAVELPPLPLPEYFQQLFARWARGEVNLTGLELTPPPR